VKLPDNVYTLQADGNHRPAAVEDDKEQDDKREIGETSCREKRDFPEASRRGE
jgi:hypothetical protein